MNWEEVLNETDKYQKELAQWQSLTHSTDRLDVYKEIDTYPISSIAKMHLVASWAMKMSVQDLLKRSIYMNIDMFKEK